MESDTQSGDTQHRQIIGAVTHRNGLGYVYFLNLRYQAQQFGFALAVCCAVSTVLGKSQKSPEQTETTVVTEENAESAE